MAILDAAGRTAARLAGSADEAPTGTNRKGPDHEDEEAARHRHGESLRVRSIGIRRALVVGNRRRERSAEHTSELQSLMRISYAVFCLKKKHNNSITSTHSSRHLHVNQTPHAPQ